MEITLISPQSLRLKTKLSALLIDPIESRGKVQADGVLLLQSLSSSVEVKDSRLTISGPGEYEISGIKITGTKSTDGISYYILADGISLLIAMGSEIKGKESLRDVDIALIFANNLVDQSALATVTNGIALFYGPQAVENIKALSKDVQPVNKFAITKDKMPSEMQVALLA